MTDEPTPTDYHRYDHNPAPWWIMALWAAYFAFAFGYLWVNL